MLTRNRTTTRPAGLCARARCAHGRHAHGHYRKGSECALCNCPRWQPAWRPRLARAVRRVEMVALIALACAGVLVILACVALIIGAGLYQT